MTALSMILMFSIIAGLYLGMHWLDRRYGWQLVKWCNGEIASPFVSSHRTDKDELRQRIEALETIVTDPKTQLRNEIDSLR